MLYIALCTCQEFSFFIWGSGCVFLFFDYHFKFKASFLCNPAHQFDITKRLTILRFFYWNLSSLFFPLIIKLHTYYSKCLLEQAFSRLDFNKHFRTLLWHKENKKAYILIYGMISYTVLGVTVRQLLLTGSRS
jgi:hypothetical protein